MTAPQPFAGVEPSRAVAEAAWLVDRLHPFAQDVGSIVPGGFDAYARLEHAQWEGGLPDHVAVVLAEHLARATTTPHDCRFGLWIGYGALGIGSTRPRAEGADLVARMAWRWTQWQAPSSSVYLVSQATGWRARGRLRRERRRVERQHREWSRHIAAVTDRCGVVAAPKREYLLFQGPVRAVISAAMPTSWPSQPDGEASVEEARQLDGPNLWWPADRAWAVASEIDLAWTYVGGSRAVIDGIVDDVRLSASPADPSDPIVAPA